MLESIRPELGRETRANEKGTNTILHSEMVPLDSVLPRCIRSSGIDFVSIELKQLSDFEVSIEFPPLIHMYVFSPTTGRVVSEKIF